MRQNMVIVTRQHSIRDRETVGGAPVWGWSVIDGAQPGDRNVCEHAKPGDYIIGYDHTTSSCRRRMLPWRVCRVPRRGDRFVAGMLGPVISYHRTPEAAVKAAAWLLRVDERTRDAAARASVRASAARGQAVPS